MSQPDDLTRWNRAGLQRFRYIDANAVTLLEALRVRLAERFPEWGGRVGVEVPADEPARARRARLTRQYEAERGPTPDWGWEITRALARACHVLVEHIDAHANEGYLGTATQWESVRRLVAMTHYEPAPPASASTPLVFLAKEGARGRVARGFAVKHSPPDGGAPVTFETLDDLDLDASLNALRARDWDRDPREVPAGTNVLELEGALPGLIVGEPLVLEAEGVENAALSAHLITRLDVDDAGARVHVAPAVGPGFARGRTVVHVRPQDRVAPLAPVRSPREVDATLRLARPPDGLRAGDVVTVTDGAARVYRRVTDVSGRRLGLDRPVGALALDQTTVAAAVALAVGQIGAAVPDTRDGRTVVVRTATAAGDWRRLQGAVVAAWDAREGALAGEFDVAAADHADGATALRLVARDGAGFALREASALRVPPLGEGALRADVPLACDAPDAGRAPLMTDRTRGAAPGDVVVIVSEDRLAWTRLGAVRVDAPAGTTELTPAAPGWQARGEGALWRASSTAFAHFRERARLRGWRENPVPVEGRRVALDAVPDALVPGRKIVAGRESVRGAATFTSVVRVDGTTVTLRDAVPEGATAGDLRLWANVVLAGHGERRPERTLGSGDATRAGQAFALPEGGVAFVADATRPHGVRADVAVAVDGRVWTQVASLRGCGPTETVYAVNVLEDGRAVVQFGDGGHGRRLPTGRGNVRVRYRIGAGLPGNLPPGCLEKPAGVDPRVAAVRQPLAAVGGNDVEDVESLRRNAPAALATLDRAVSLEDFARLAARHSSVWQARAFAGTSPASRQQGVDVVVVPAGGGALDASLKRALERYLRAHAPPWVAAAVYGYEAEPLVLAVQVEVDTAAYDPEGVVGAVRAALLDAFSLRRRLLGQPVYLSEVYQVVENVSGVVSSLCVFDPAGSSPGAVRQVVHPRFGGNVLHLPSSGAGLGVDYQAYTP